MQLEFELTPPRRGLTLLIASSPEATWQGGIAPWLERHVASAWQHDRPALVVAPTRGHLNAIKARLLGAGRSALGLQFLTPPHLRALVVRDLEFAPTRTEHLRLLLALAAEEELSGDQLSDAERLAAVSVQRTPNHLLSLLERLSAAGVDFDDADLATFRPVVRRFRDHRAAANFALAPEADRAALARAQTNAPRFQALLLTGFHGAHWPLWHLLRAVAQASESCTLLLQYPRDEAGEVDAAWIGSWEESFGEAKPIEASAEPAPAANRATLFLAGLDTREQGEAIIAATHHFLADPACTRLGILFPAAGALSRLVASAFTRQALPHYDAMGQMVPGTFEAPVFQHWLELQRTPRLAALLRFLNALESDHSFFEKISRQTICEALRKALGALAIDDLGILIASARGREGKGELVSAALDRVHFLPASATYTEFLAATRDAFGELGWQERWREIESQAASGAELTSPFSRTLFLRWLEEIAFSFRIARHDTGAHPYARVHLITPAQAEDQTWSHLILTGLNEGSWPAAPAGEFLPASQIDAINESMRQLNRAATRRGRQGEGHVAVREGRALFLGVAQQRQLAQAQFAGLLENTTHGLAFTASVIQEDAPERISNPSEFLNHAYHAAHGTSLSQQAMRELRETTRRWVGGAQLEAATAFADTPGVQQTRVAYDARRVIEASGEYDFALREPPKKIALLSVSEVEEMLKAPAIVWLRRYLGVEGEEDSAHTWDATVGKWSHEWLASLSDRAKGGFASFPSATEIETRIRAAAERKRAEVEQLCRQAGRPLPDWWKSGWEGALCLAQTLGRVLSTAADWPWLATEWRLDAQPIEVGEGWQLILRGRADLMLAQTASAPASLEVPALWIIDFKTGNKPSLSKGLSDSDTRLDKVRTKVLKGDALQLSLYAQAVRQLGAQSVNLSLISPLLVSAEPQLSLDDFEKCQPAFQELAKMQATGVFGFKGRLRDAFAFTRPYPLATLAVDSEIVDERWEETHRDLVIEAGYFQ